MNRKQMATTVSRTGSERDERDTASYMTHSLDVHRASYQHSGGLFQGKKQHNELSVRPILRKLASHIRHPSYAHHLLRLSSYRYIKLKEVATGSNSTTTDEVPPPKKKRRIYFSNEEEKIIKDHFELTKHVKTAECVEFLAKHQVGDQFQNRSVQSIQDKVKTLIRTIDMLLYMNDCCTTW